MALLSVVTPPSTWSGHVMVVTLCGKLFLCDKKHVQNKYRSQKENIKFDINVKDILMLTRVKKESLYILSPNLVTVT